MRVAEHQLLSRDPRPGLQGRVGAGPRGVCEGASEVSCRGGTETSLSVPRGENVHMTTTRPVRRHGNWEDSHRVSAALGGDSRASSLLEKRQR